MTSAYATRSIARLSLPLVLLLSACAGSSTDGDRAAKRLGVTGTLPSGTSIQVVIDSPLDGAVHPIGPVAVVGSAAIGEAAPVARTTMVYVMDLSGSVSSLSGCGGDLNDDGRVDSILDCEIAALTAINDAVAAAGTVADVGVAVFGTLGAPADIGPADGEQLLTGPLTDASVSGNPDVIDVLRSSRPSGILDLFTPRDVDGWTSYGSGVNAAADILNTSTMPNKVVVLVSDGVNNRLPAVADALPNLPAGTIVHTLAVGANAGCDKQPGADPDDPLVYLGTLREVSDPTGGTCTEVADTQVLPDIAPSIVAAQLVDLTVAVDGGSAPVELVTPTLPQTGPATVDFSTTLAGLSTGSHEVCATAEGSDPSGEGTVTDCITLYVEQPNSVPVAQCQDIVVEADPACTAAGSIDDGSYDPDGDTFSCTQTPEGPYPAGDNPVVLGCTDSWGASSSCEGLVQVIDTTAPTVQTVATPISLWPSNHKYKALSVDACIVSITDACEGTLDPTTVARVTRITSDEAEMATGSGNTCDDARITGPTTFELRAERSGSGDGRVYTVTFAVSDGAGNETEAACQIHVPHSQNGDAALDSGCAYCVGGACGNCPATAPICP